MSAAAASLVNSIEPGWREPPTLALVPPARSVYRARQGNPLALGGSLAMVAAITASVALLGERAPAKRPAPPLTVFQMELAPPPPPRPPSASPAPSSPTPPVTRPVSPAPVVALPPVAQPAMATVAEATPPAPPAVAAPAAAGPAVAPAPEPQVAGPVDGGDLSARMIAAPAPSYPEECRRRREQGIVKLRVLVGLDGAVDEVSVASSSGSTRLDKAALGAVRRWRWSPVRRDGLAVMVRGFVTIPFVLKV